MSWSNLREVVLSVGRVAISGESMQRTRKELTLDDADGVSRVLYPDQEILTKSRYASRRPSVGSRSVTSNEISSS